MEESEREQPVPFSDARLHGNRPTMSTNQAVSNRQSQTSPAMTGGEKRVKDKREPVLGNAHAFVVYGDFPTSLDLVPL